jgi:beta-lactamase regulating signal transducer with metallopeptidase domain
VRQYRAIRPVDGAVSMKTKDTIASWLLALFVLGPFIRAFYGLIDALKLNCPAGTILWYLGIILVVAASGLFLIVRFVHVMHNLEYYESEERQKEKEQPRR